MSCPDLSREEDCPGVPLCVPNCTPSDFTCGGGTPSNSCTSTWSQTNPSCLDSDGQANSPCPSPSSCVPNCTPSDFTCGGGTPSNGCVSHWSQTNSSCLDSDGKANTPCPSPSSCVPICTLEQLKCVPDTNVTNYEFNCSGVWTQNDNQNCTIPEGYNSCPFTPCTQKCTYKTEIDPNSHPACSSCGPPATYGASYLIDYTPPGMTTCQGSPSTTFTCSPSALCDCTPEQMTCVAKGPESAYDCMGSNIVKDGQNCTLPLNNSCTLAPCTQKCSFSTAVNNPLPGECPTCGTNSLSTYKTKLIPNVIPPEWTQNQCYTNATLGEYTREALCPPMPPCAQDCKITYSDWSACSGGQCGTNNGTQSRTFNVTQAAQNGGQCPSPNLTQPCPMPACPACTSADYACTGGSSANGCLGTWSKKTASQCQSSDNSSYIGPCDQNINGTCEITTLVWSDQGSTLNALNTSIQYAPINSIQQIPLSSFINNSDYWLRNGDVRVNYTGVGQTFVTGGGSLYRSNDPMSGILLNTDLVDNSTNISLDVTVTITFMNQTVGPRTVNIQMM